VDRLRVLVEDYLKYVQSEPTVPTELKADVLAIFCNLHEIYEFHNKTFLPALEACKEDDITAVMQCFLTHVRVLYEGAMKYNPILFLEEQVYCVHAVLQEQADI
jgi:hypothetical protein